VPALSGVYSSLHNFVETLPRVVAGVALVTHRLGKIGDPFGSAGMVESLGFYPGAFGSLMLSLTEFLGGIFIALGLDAPRVFGGNIRAARCRMVSLDHCRPRLLRCGEVDPVGRGLFLLYHQWRQPPFDRCEDWSSVLNKDDVIMLTGTGRGLLGCRAGQRDPITGPSNNLA
jgi:hypothetical protein